MARETLTISRNVLAWAHARSGYSLDELKESFKNFDEWLDGTSFPTYPQLEQLADKLKLPIAVFFFPEPPKLPPIRESFRTLPDAEFDAIPRGVLRMLRKAKAMQLNLAELNDGKNPVANLITHQITASPKDPDEKLAEQVRAFLNVPLEVQQKWPDTETALDNWRKAITDAGVFVFKDAFREDGFAGFCLYDDQFPIIYVNNSAPKTRQIFTLFHELAHLIFQTSGIDTETNSYVDHLAGDAKMVEVICNRFAGRFLVPQNSLAAALKGKPHNRETAAELARLFHVSREVIYRMLLDAGLVAQTEYESAAKEWREQAQAGSAGSGGDFYNTQLAYLGNDYVRLAFSRYYQNRIDDLQLAEYLNIAPKNLPTLEARFSGRKA